MNIETKDINECIKIISASGGVSLAEVARRVGESPQSLNQRLKQGKIQKTLDYLDAIGEACGYKFKWDFEKIE